MGALLVETWRTVSDRPPSSGEQGANPPPPDTHTRTHTFQVSACRASPIDTSSHPSLERKGVLLEEGFRPGRESPPPLKPTVWKASAHRCLVGRFLYFSALFVYTETTTKSWTVSRGRGAPRHRTGQSVSSSGLCLSESTVLLCCIDRFAAPMLRPFVEAFTKGVFFLGDCGFRNTSFKMEVHYC